MSYKRSQHKCFALALGVAMFWGGSCATSNAQDVEKTQANLKSYNFIEVQGGVQTTLTDAKLDKLITPVGAVSIGRIVIDAKGDTVQPFSENDKNRCVIIIGPAE